MLTRTSGLSYNFFNSLLQKWRVLKGGKIAGGDIVVQRFLCPLTCEPGTCRDYSCAHYWLGQAVELLSGEESLEAYMEKNI